MQFIILVESNSKSKSDYLYIYSTITHFFNIEKGQHKFSPIYLDGKGNFNKQEKLINTLISKYKNTGRSEIFVCTDIDTITNPQYKLNQRIEKYCLTHNYNYVFFNKDIEDVYLKRSVNDGDKTIEAQRFYALDKIRNINKTLLIKEKPISFNTSNILLVFSKYLKFK